jgi:uncharacterized protein with HEPN domain
VHHVLECIQRIDRYCQSGEDAFRGSDLVQDAVLRNLQTLAESTQRIGDGSPKALRPEVDWHAIAGFRNVLADDYLGINLDRVWEIVSVHLPALRLQMEAIRREADSPYLTTLTNSGELGGSRSRGHGNLQ